MNNIVLMGRLARNPDVRQIATQKGETTVARFPLVVKRNRTNKAFPVMITAYGSNAAVVQKYLEQGTKITVGGELVITQFKDQEAGNATYFTEVIMETMEFAESKGKKNQNGDGFVPSDGDTPFEIPEAVEQEMPFR